MSHNIISEDFHTEGKIINFNNGKKESFEWQGNFDGNKGSVNIKSNNFNGKTTYTTIPFDRDNFKDLFTHQISGISLENRLLSDFDINDFTKVNPDKNKTKSSNKNKNKKRKTRKYKK